MWPKTAPKKFIIWGLEHYKHTHSYIHYAFEKAAIKLGWDVEWVQDTPELGIYFNECDEYLFLTIGISDRYIPINPKAFYILHNCEAEKYTSIPEKNKLIIQVYTTDVDTRDVIKLPSRKYEFWQPNGNVFYMPWATDILPDEINQNIEKVKVLQIPNRNRKEALFLGTVNTETQFGNIDEITKFEGGCKNMKVPLLIANSTSINQGQSIELLQQVYITPSIVGTWQKRQGYIPCRIFKTISYGQLGVTNSKQAYDIINNLGVYSEDESQLCSKAVEVLESESGIEQIIDAMKLIRDHHTYINRLESIQFIFRLKQ
jgi:hypothetical protein